VDLFVCYLIYERRHSSKCWVGFAGVAIRFRRGPNIALKFCSVHVYVIFILPKNMIE
jgi:hypothetical protein